MTEITVYYDGACPLCAREVAFYRRRRGGDRLNWVDVSAIEDQEVAPGLSKSAALSRFHVRKSDGQMVSGGLAFAALWHALPAFRPVGRLFGSPPLSWLLELSYILFLRFRPQMQQLASRPSCSRGCGIKQAANRDRSAA